MATPADATTYATYIQQALTNTLAKLWHVVDAETPPPQTKAEWLERLTNQPASETIISQLYDLLENRLPQAVLVDLETIKTERDKVNCHQCGVCCRLTSHPHNYDTLLEKAAQGDDFAQQFTSVMLPYASEAVAYERFPEFVTQLKQMAGDSLVYFYHCPYVQEDNLCGLWGNNNSHTKRPAMCGSYPETPLVWQQPNCAWQPWQQSQQVLTLACHAKLAVYEQLLTVLQNNTPTNDASRGV